MQRPKRSSAIVAIIPARYASTRLPGKPLCQIHGRPMLQWVYDSASRAKLVDRVLVATDDQRIVEAVSAFGGEAVMTLGTHTSGTDRLAEVARSLEAAVLVNVQGDEPGLPPEALDALCTVMASDPSVPMATLATPIRNSEEMLSPDVVKVVVDSAGDALFFSRAPIPHVRLAPADPRASAERAISEALARRHLGVYAYRREALLRFAALPPSPLERAESLEQLRALHHGIRIRVVDTHIPAGVSVDTPEDLERARILLAASGRSQ